MVAPLGGDYEKRKEQGMFRGGPNTGDWQRLRVARCNVNNMIVAGCSGSRPCSMVGDVLVMVASPSPAADIVCTVRSC